jgi:hypothetical protein
MEAGSIASSSSETSYGYAQRLGPHASRVLQAAQTTSLQTPLTICDPAILPTVKSKSKGSIGSCVSGILKHAGRVRSQAVSVPLLDRFT